MTNVLGRDMSDYDSDETSSGYSFIINKVTEGTGTVHKSYGRRITMYRDRGIPVLGSYHVLRTPGSGGAGSLSSQLDYWLSHMDSATPWWRSWPHWIMQIDAEKWPYDAVTATENMLHHEAKRVLPASKFNDIMLARASITIDFANLVLAEHLPARCVAYASRGQYGNNLTGLPVDLWNAHYVGAYPGDGSADWNDYSNRPVKFLQFTSTPYDKDAFRGTLNDLLTYVGGNTMSVADDKVIGWIDPRVEAITNMWPTLARGDGKGNEVAFVLAITDLLNKVDTLQGTVNAIQLGGIDLDALAAKVAALVGPAVHTELSKLDLTVAP